MLRPSFACQLQCATQYLHLLTRVLNIDCASLTIIRVVRSGFPPKTNRKRTESSKFFGTIETIRSFVRLLVRSKIFQILVRADAIDLVQKSSNFEPSSRFFGRLKILNSKRRRNEAFEFDSSCRAPQRALQLESNSNAKV